MLHGLSEVLSPIRIIVAGVMARTAAEESGLAGGIQWTTPEQGNSCTGGSGVSRKPWERPRKPGNCSGILLLPGLGENGLVHIECSGRMSIAGIAGMKNWRVTFESDGIREKIVHKYDSPSARRSGDPGMYSR